MPPFTHLHVHTQYSMLDGAIRIGDLIEKTKEYCNERGRLPQPDEAGVPFGRSAILTCVDGGG